MNQDLEFVIQLSCCHPASVINKVDPWAQGLSILLYLSVHVAEGDFPVFYFKTSYKAFYFIYRIIWFFLL